MNISLDTIRLASIMGREIATVTPQEPALRAAGLMSAKKIGSVIVVESEKPIGIITERDIIREVGLCGDRLSEKSARDVMTSPLLTRPEDITLREAATFLRENHFRRVVLVDQKGRMTGIATQTDILRSMFNALLRSMTGEEIVAMAAHDLKSPLTPILAAAKLLRGDEMGPMTPQQKKTLDIIIRSAENMDSIVRDLQEVTSLDAGGIFLDLRAFSLRELVQRCVTPHTAHAEEKGISLTWSAPPLASRVFGDPERLAEVLDNLVTNAIKFASPGNKVDVEARLDDGFLLRVRDTGPGIPLAEHKNIFERFTKGTPRPTQGEGSTGLGLAIVKRLVELHGGTIALESAEGKGSVFTVRIPGRPPSQQV